MKKTPLHNRLERFSKDMQDLTELAKFAFFDALGNFKSDMQMVNREALEDGEYTNSDPIKPEYSPYTVRKKQIKGQRYDVVTLKDKGDFHKSIRYDVIDDKVTVSATDWKTKVLNPKYRTPETREIYGMQPERYNDGIFPRVVKLANSDLFKSFKR